MATCVRFHVAVLPAVVMAIPGMVSAQGLLQPSDLEYLGAFRLPEVQTAEPAVWEWGGLALAFRPGGDPGGPADGFPGSLYVTGLATESWVAEVGIPQPSPSRDLSSLPAATLLQPLTDVRGGLFPELVELPRVGLEVLPAQSGQSEGHLYLAWGQHFQFDEETIVPSHAWCDLDLASPDSRGRWWLGTEADNLAGFIYRTNSYLFAIPAAWADQHVGGMRLASGRSRDGGISGRGAVLLASAPWLDGNPVGSPPEDGAELDMVPLLLYGHIADPSAGAMDGYNVADEWQGGAWLEAGGRSAVVFAGTKADGYAWYGFQTPDGVGAPPLYPQGAPCPYEEGELMCYRPDGSPCTAEDMAPCAGAAVEPESRAWWASRFDAQLLFYDPDDLAAVAAGTLDPDEPQPYAVLDLDDDLLLDASAADITVYVGSGDQRRDRVSELAYDPDNDLLYLLELFADESRPVVHVWRVATEACDPCTLTVQRAGTGSGNVTSSPAGIDCGPDCSQAFDADTRVTLTAAPDAGSIFSGWSGDCAGHGQCVVDMDGPRSVTARFDGPGCVASDTAMCLNDGRFRVEVGWTDYEGDSGAGHVVPYGSDDSGMFWFFRSTNWEMLVKVLDGCGVNGAYWILAAATTNVGYTLRVTDTTTGAVREYANPLGTASPAIIDAAAFASCP